MSQEERDLSFAKNASGDMALRCNTFITVMQTAELRDLDDPSLPGDLPGKWAFFIQSQVSPRAVIVGEIGSERSLQMPGIEDHEMV
jgi:hypothetical protein